MQQLKWSQEYLIKIYPSLHSWTQLDGGSPNKQKSFGGCGCDSTDRAERDLKYDQARGDAEGLPGFDSEIYPVDTIKMREGVAQRPDAEPGSDSDDAQ